MQTLRQWSQQAVVATAAAVVAAATAAVVRQLMTRILTLDIESGHGDQN
jgi:negative regulator of sigma E activity